MDRVFSHRSQRHHIGEFGQKSVKLDRTAKAKMHRRFRDLVIRKEIDLTFLGMGRAPNICGAMRLWHFDRLLPVVEITIPLKQSRCSSGSARDHGFDKVTNHRGQVMIENMNQASAERSSPLFHLDGALQETFSHKFSNLQSEKTNNLEEPPTIDFSAEDIYARTVVDANRPKLHANEQQSETNERFSSRMNREDDRQPYLDAQRHGNAIERRPSNEQAAELNEGFRSRMNREGDPQPYLDPERYQPAN